MLVNGQNKTAKHVIETGNTLIVKNEILCVFAKSDMHV